MAKWWRLERRPSARWERRLGEWFTGPVPPKGATTLERLRFVRRVTVRPMLFYFPIFAVILIVGTSDWVTVVICALFVFGGANALAVTLRVRRAERAEREGR
jgi:hypothetical protein